MDIIFSMSIASRCNKNHALLPVAKEREVVCMNVRQRAVFPPVLLILAFFLCGCAGSGAHANAITNTIVSYSDYYIEVRNLSSQVSEQYRSQNANQTTFDYSILAEIPDYTAIDPSAVVYTLPDPQVSSRSVEGYRQQCSLTLRQALESYALNGEISAYVQLPLSVSVSKTADGCSAVLSSQSKLSIQQTVEGMVAVVLERDAAYLANLNRMRVASSLSSVLSVAFYGEQYADQISVENISLKADGTYAAELAFPEPAFVFAALGDVYAASFNQPFFGDALDAELSTEGIREIDLTRAPMLRTSVSVSLDPDSGECLLLDDGGIAKAVSDAKTSAETQTSAAVNAAWRVEPLEPPASGKVLEGKSKGNSIVFRTSRDLGEYFYVRFYAISGEDITEEGTLALGVFIKGGKSASLRLPSGYYRVTCVVGGSWYGLEHLFGSDGKTYDGGNAIRSQSGYINTISFE